MSYKILTYKEIDRTEWSKLVRESKTGTWFQTPEAYRFYESLPELFQPFVVAVERVRGLEVRGLAGICVGYVTKERSAIKQFFTRRAIIIGGPCLAINCINEEVELLLSTLRKQLSTGAGAPIYIETRNLNDYSRWKEVFEKAGFEYRPHLNIQMDITSEEAVIERIGKHRRHRIQQSLRNGATIVEQPSWTQVEEWYALLEQLYQTRIHKPLPTLPFFAALYDCPDSRFTLVKYQEHIIGGAIAVCLKDKAMYEWYACGRDEEKGNISPASVTKYGEIQYAVANGIPILDLMGAGEPGVPYGVRDFKSEFGGELVEHGRWLAITKPLLYRIGTWEVKLLKRLKL